jgi:quinol monooxygenase YgiN
MRTVMVRYKTEAGRAAENEALVHAVFDELRAQAPGGLKYATYRLADGVTFVHVATVSAVENPLTALPAFKAFQRDIKARCVEEPVVMELSSVDAYDPEAGA